MAPLKRKWSGPPVINKSRRLSDETEIDPSTSISLELKSLEESISESQGGLNNLAKLISLAQISSGRAQQVALTTTCRAFFRTLTSHTLANYAGKDEKRQIVRKWLSARTHDFVEVLLGLVQASDQGTAILAIDLRMQLLDAEIQSSRATEYSGLLKSRVSDIVLSMLSAQIREPLRDHFVDRYGHRYADIRIAIYQSISDPGLQLLSRCGLTDIIALLSLMGVPPSKESLPSFSAKDPSATDHSTRQADIPRKQAGLAWLSVLAQNLDKAQTKQILAIMTHTIAPTIENLERLSDFLDESFSHGGAISLMALSGLFHLIKEKNFDYPQFYVKLYSLLDSETLHFKHRSRFLRLLDTFLSSSHLPSTLVASFLKRLCHLCLHAPPAAIVAVVPLIYNLLKSNPACTVTIHRAYQGRRGQLTDQSSPVLADPFDPLERDPLATHAIDSSLWELETLQSHFHPNVATICKIISEQFTKHAYTIDDFLDHSYASIADSELQKGVRKVPVVEHFIPKRIMSEETGAPPYCTGSLWKFSNDS